MSLERLYALFVRCFNRGDFSPLLPYIAADASFGSIDSIYVYKGSQRVVENLTTRYGSGVSHGCKAFTGFVVEPNALGARHYAPCALIARDTPQNIIFLVRITTRRRRIGSLRFESPQGHAYTRGEALTV